MSVFVVLRYVVKSEKQTEFESLTKKYLEYLKDPEKSKELKSWKLFVQLLGGIANTYIEMMEFDSMADVEKWNTRMMNDEEFLKSVYQEFMLIIEPTTYSRNVWNLVI